MLRRQNERLQYAGVVIASRTMTGAQSMQANSCTHTAGLPDEGQRVEFVLDDREVALRGTYAHGTFQSRWSGYGRERVRFWRPDDADMQQCGAIANYALAP